MHKYIDQIKLPCLAEYACTLTNCIMQFEDHVLQQYWAGQAPYEYVSVDQFSEAFQNSPTGQRNAAALAVPYDKARHKKEALVHNKWSLTGHRNSPSPSFLPACPTCSVTTNCIVTLMHPSSHPQVRVGPLNQSLS